MTIPGVLAATADRLGDGVAVVDGDQRLTYRQLLEESKGFAAALVAGGLEPGERVSIWMPNSARWIVAVLGIWQAGGVLVPINTRFKGGEAADILSRSGARVLVTVTDFLDADYLDMLGRAGVELPSLRHRIVASGDASYGASTWSEFTAAGSADAEAAGEAAAQAAAEVERRIAALDDGDPSDILFTSGTTGRAKGVVQTHGRTLRVASDWVAMTGLRAGDRYLMVNPYFHMFGLKAGILASITAGATMYPERVFDVARVLQRVSSEQITVLPGAPTIYQAILDHPDRSQYDLSSLRVAVTGSADIPVRLIERIYDELPFRMVVSGYGLTEAGTASGTDPDDSPEVVATTVGRARPGFEIKLVDGTGSQVPVGDAGEILLRGPSVMSHYLDDPAATAAALSEDGWLRTGDIGVMDEAGLLRIVGRAKDMFIVGGFNAYPAEIENLMLAHPAIHSVAVIGVPDERLGEVGMAFVVLHEGASAAPDELIAWCRDHMANYKAPRRVEIVEALPLNATGKVMKEELRARAARG
ncbi:MAG TPA: FadD3 family acyl-CoA ligase [Mycobacteriales bacterium]|nr:FadD3 family acyl-CoA ligase [Mycobacteriales bacterium]